MTDAPLRVCICGGGNGAHVLSVLSSSRANTDVRVLTLFADEAERWTNALKKNCQTVVLTNKDGSKTEVKSTPRIVTKDPKKAVPESDIILFTVPAFAHERFFQAVEPYVKKGVTIVGLPGQPGFEFQCRDILGAKADFCSIVSFETLPWACRIKEYGQRVEVLGTKSFLSASVLIGNVPPVRPPIETTQYLHGAEPVFRKAKHFLEITMMAHSFLHLAILYGQWKDWDGKPVATEPLFYQGITQETANLLTACSDEYHAVAEAIMEARPEIDMTGFMDLYAWYMEYYQNDITDPTSLYTAIHTNRSYIGLTHPTEKVDGGFVPNFKNRYLTEDLPMGMIVVRGIADAVGVKIPICDKLIVWSQEKMGTEYLVNGELKGKDVSKTRCPLRYGFNTLDGILKGKK